MTEFNDLGLAEPLLRAVSAEGYSQPTPIQSQVIPAMLAGRDVLGIAQTGTGKTASFVLPLLHHIAVEGVRPKGKTCGALILAPTRELAAQIAASVRVYGKFLKLTSTVVTGGAKPGPQIKSLSRGVDVVIATPGRLLDHLSTDAVRLDQTRTVVLDEADQMLDLGFVPAIRKILAAVPKERQTVLLSATMPKQIRSLAHDFLHKPAEISVAPVSKPIDRIDQQVFHMEQGDKRHRLAEILSAENVERAIVFTRTKRGADRVSKYLSSAGHHSAAIHGDKSQNQRDRALKAFRAGNVPILVATDIAARGIDIDDVSHVINFELPNVPEAYVHRIGRTARAGKEGIAISLCSPDEADYLRDIERLIRRNFDGTPFVDEKPKQGARRKSAPGQRQRKRQAAEAKANGAGDGGNGAAPGKKRRSRPSGQKDNAARKAKPARQRRAARRAEGRQGGEGDAAGLARLLGA